MILVVTLKFKEHLLNVILQGNGEQGSSEAENPGALASDISTFSSYHTNITEERYLLEFDNPFCSHLAYSDCLFA